MRLTFTITATGDKWHFEVLKPPTQEEIAHDGVIFDLPVALQYLTQ